jgi:hypothetical protein
MVHVIASVDLGLHQLWGGDGSPFYNWPDGMSGLITQGGGPARKGEAQVKLESLKTDSKMERGTWVRLDPSCRVKVVYTNSPEYAYKQKVAMKPYRTVLAKTRDFDDAMSQEDQDKLTVQLLVDYVLLDWEGVEYGTNGNGESVELPYSKDNARKVLTEVPAFRQMVEEAAATLSNFRTQDAEADAKNSAA